MLSPNVPESPKTTQLTAPSRSAKGDRRSTSPATSSLWGMVTESPRTPSAAAPTSGLARPPGCHPEAHRDPVQAHVGEGPVVQPRGERMGHRVPDDTHHGRGCGQGHQGSPRCLARASLASCSASVSAKASVPSDLTNTKYSHEPAGGSRAAFSAGKEGKQIGVGVRPLLR